LRKVDDIKKIYKIGKELGSGSFGSVRLVTHIAANRDFALKIIKKSSLKEKVYIDLMESELKVSSEIEHPNIVKVFDILEDEKHVFIVMELVPGGDLLKRVIAMSQFTEKDAAQTIR